MRYSQDRTESMPVQGDQLPVSRILPRPSLHHLREQLSLQALADSIRAGGLRRPVLVRPAGHERYVIVSGNRRLMACRMLGLTHIRACLLAPEAERQTEEQLMEALITRRLHYLEEADALGVLQRRDGISGGELAAMTGLHPRLIQEELRLCAFGEELRMLLMDEGVPLSVALTLLRLPDDRARLHAGIRIVRERLGVRDAALLVCAMQGRLQTPEASDADPPTDLWAEENSQNHTGKVIGVMRDQRLYLNAIRDIAGQMQSAGVDATLREQRIGGRLEMLISVSTRRRRAARHQSM